MRDNILPYLDERIIAEKACGLGLQVQMLCEKYAEQGRVEEVRQLRMLHDRLWAIVQEVKEHHSENQPREEAGTPEGGRWIPYGVIPGNDEVTFINTIEHPSGGRLNRANVFVGGLNDDSSKIVRNSFSLGRYTYGDNYYAEQDVDGSGKLVELINEMPLGRQVNLIGHSYGADTIARVAIALPGRVHTLITIDPVSKIETRPKYSDIRKSVKRWINVNAAGQAISIGDISALFGGAWNSGPEDFANIYIEAPYVHEAFDDMMLYAPAGSSNPQSMLNR